ncbi:cache domain-containing protein [Kineosporia babensis]
MRTETPLGAVARDVSGLFEGLFVALEDMRECLAGLFALGPAPAQAVVGVLQERARARLDAGLVLGCGFVSAKDALADRSLYLAWWQGERRQFLGEAGAPDADVLDYTRREWFRVPEQTRRRHVTGPYVDYICTDEYVVTLSVPVVVQERMLGIVGADTLVETLEEVLLEGLGAAGATLVSGHGRVIASADHRLAAGKLINLDACREGAACGSLPLSVVRM